MYTKGDKLPDYLRLVYEDKDVGVCCYTLDLSRCIFIPKSNDLIKEMEKNHTIKLHKYEKYLNLYKDPYGGFTLLNRTPKAGEIFMIDDITDKLWELGCICDNGDIQIVQRVKEDKETGFIPPFEIRNINPKEHRFWAMLDPKTKCL